MIGHLEGSVRSLDPEIAVLDVGGVGYEVHIPLSTYYRLQERFGTTDSAPVGLHIHTHVREGEISLYGFGTSRERALFRLLIAVSGVGPRLAQVVLSGMSPPELVAAIAAGDVPALVRVPGIGKRTAERLILELRDKVRELPGGDAAPQEAPASDEILEALVSLGYKQSTAERAVARVRKEEGDLDLPELLRASLKRLSRV